MAEEKRKKRDRGKSQRKRALVVDNHRVILKFMRTLLEKQNYEVRVAEDGLSALQILQAYTPHVIFVDLIMPKIDGKKLCQLIRTMPKLKHTFIIILSAVAVEDQPRYAALGADACIAKGPVNIMTQNILAILDRLEKGQGPEPHERVIGVESVNPRVITKELLSSQKHLEVILRSMREGIMEITAEGKIVYANPVAAGLFDMPENRLLASDLTELFHGDARQRILGLLQPPPSAPRSTPEEAPVVFGDKLFSMKLLPIVEDGDRAFIVILNDVTRRKQMEAQLRQAQKMEAIGTLAGGIAHDFNNLLMGIQGHASLMAMHMQPGDKDFSHVKGIQEMVQRGSDLTAQLLSFSRGAPCVMRPMDLNELIQNSARMFARTRKEITIREAYEPELWPVEADPGQMEQVLLNLYVNAWQAMPGGGELILQTENTTLEASMVAPFDLKPGRYVRVSVQDTGVGMDERTRERVFDPFFTTRGMGRGTGLGLASVYGIIQNHGGFIELETEKGEGTTFLIYLPATEKDPQREEPLSTKLLRGSETILLVDDEAMILEVAEEILKGLGYTVMRASSGAEAIELYRENQESIDLIILDIIMPGMGGGETFDHIRAIDPGAKVLLASGYTMEGEAAQIMERGCDGFIQKPFRIEELSATIRAILDKDR